MEKNLKICILTPRFPLPECGGDLLRINNIARYLKSKGHILILVSYVEDTYAYDLQSARELYDQIYIAKRHKWSSWLYSILFMLAGRPIQCGYYYSKCYRKLFQDVVRKEQPDLYVSHLLRMIPFIENAKVQDKTIVEMTDALSKTYSMSAKGKGNWVLRNVYKIEKNLIAKYERYVLEHYSKVVLVSPDDIALLKNNNGKDYSNLSLHTNGVECLKQTRTEYNPNKICFIGHMQSLQNQDATIYFVNDILPLLIREKPDLKFYIVGAHPPKNILKLDNGKNIFITGFVEDLNEFVSDSSVVVAPVRIAAGIQNKVLVAMGCGIPVIMTSLISRAIPELIDGENCIIRDDTHSFAKQCIRLMNDKDARNTIGQKGYNLVLQHYSWGEKLKDYEML